MPCLCSTTQNSQRLCVKPIACLPSPYDHHTADIFRSCADHCHYSLCIQNKKNKRNYSFAWRIIRKLLNDYVKFYRQLDEENKRKFEERVEHFLSTVHITGVNAEVEDIDMIFIGAGAIIPVFFFPDWQYINLHEVLVYPGAFNEDFDQAGNNRHIAGMVGSGSMQNVMIITKWQLRQGFINNADHRNTAIHEFVHLIDKMDGTMDGVPEIILERKYVNRWTELMNGNHLGKCGCTVQILTCMAQPTPWNFLL